MRRFTTALVVAIAGLLTLAGAAPAAKPGPYEGRAKSFRNILPPGSNGLANAGQIAAFLATGDRPRHNDDQLDMYEDLVYATPGLKRKQLPNYFKDASFGVRPGDVERQYDPCSPLDQTCPDVVIQRDAGFGVPHIYGGTRAGAMFGAGYVAGEDRLFFIDVLRHAGRAQLSSFVGGAPGNREMDRDVWRISPYSEADLRRQVEQFDDLYGAQGAQLQEDLRNYVDGVNAYIDQARTNPNKLPGEYFAINRPQGPEEWKDTDVVAIAALVGGIFGKGGGREVDSAQVLQAAKDEFGGRRGRGVFSDFRSAEDPEAPTTVFDERFPYQKPPAEVDERSVAIPDEGSVVEEPVIESSAGTGGGSVEGGPGGEPMDDEPETEPAGAGSTGQQLRDGLLSFPSGNSNALLVSGRESSSGHPLAVFGPQTGYFAPQVLMEMDIHAPQTSDGPPIDARGVAFPGTNLYVQLGRGRDYSWSATSAGQDNVDTFAVKLCQPGGGKASVGSRFYRFRGSCLPMEALKRRNAWTPNAADQTPPGSETLRTFRTKLGLVISRGRLDGDPVAYTSLRSTYLHEVDSAIGFADFNNPKKIDDARDYQRAAYDIGYTFNWFYADEKDITYFNSGDNPVRAEGTDPNFPTLGTKKYEWEGFRPNALIADYTPFSAHPRVTNQSYITSWNNKQARGYRASDANYSYSSVYRSEPLDDRIRRGIAGDREMNVVELIDAAQDAGTVDLRGDKVLPWALKVLGEPRDPQLAAAVSKLRAWTRDGAHRRDSDRSGKYEHAAAIRIMDAWWPRMIAKEFKPELGRPLFKRLTGMIELDNEPNNHGAHLGSAYQTGWYGYAEKDLRTVLGKRVRGRYSREYCGGGKLSRCRDRLERSLAAALANDGPEQLYRDEVCEDEGKGLDPQLCFDSIRHRPLGGITQPLIHWMNRPTFQQVVEITGDDESSGDDSTRDRSNPRRFPRRDKPRR